MAMTGGQELRQSERQVVGRDVDERIIIIDEEKELT